MPVLPLQPVADLMKTDLSQYTQVIKSANIKMDNRSS